MPNDDYIKRSDAFQWVCIRCSDRADCEPLADRCYVEQSINKIPAADVEPKQKWIPVTERLPVGGDDSGAICENVCLMLDDGTVSCGWMNGITKKVYFLNARDDFIIKAQITRVTHWMPLPEPPKEEDDPKEDEDVSL